MNRNKQFIIHLLYPFVIAILSSLILLSIGYEIVNIGEDMLQSAIVLGADGLQKDDKLVSKIEGNNGLDFSDAVNKGKATVPDYGTLYASIVVDDIDLDVPLYYGDDSSLLQYGAGQYANDIIPGESGLILIGAHDITYFNRLDQIQINQTVKVATDYGEYEYQVKEIQILKIKEANEYCRTVKDGLILYTCYPIGEIESDRSQRIIVYCEPDIKELTNEK